MDNKELQRHYLSELPREEIEKLILYPSGLWQDIYNIVAEDNDEYACDLLVEILGKGYSEWTTFDSTSYDWWLNIKAGRYGEVLYIDQYGYFSDDDAKEIKELQAKVKELSDKVDDLDGDDPEYYEKIDKWESEADELADKIIQIVRKVVKQAEEVTDEQCVEMFIGNDMGNNYYYLGDDKGTIYRDYTESYETKYKES